jgi:hypothetical protein
MRTVRDPAIPSGANQEFNPQGTFHGQQLEDIGFTAPPIDESRSWQCFPRRSQRLDAIQPLTTFLVLDRALLMGRPLFVFTVPNSVAQARPKPIVPA